MTLEHFFTSTELKDGLTTPTRVTELLTLMQKEKDINESTRHWSNVAITLATTENKECLDLFVQLDGLSFIDKWLKEAQNDTENSDLEEELIIGVLRALERLQVDSDRSGIGKTVEGLFCHGNSVVREKAKALVDRWTPVPDGMECDSVAVGNEEKVEQETDKEEIPIHETESPGPVDQPAVPDSIPPVEVSDSVPPETDLTGVSDSVPPVAGDNGDPVEAHLAGVSDSTSPAAGGGGDGGVGGVREELDVSEMDKDIEDENEKQEIAGAVESTALLPSSTTDADNDTKTEVSEKDEDMIEDSENPKTASNTESEKDDGIESENNNDSGSDSSFSKKSTKGQDDDLISKRPSDMELDYGIVDPLELARQVAIEIEREVDSNSGGQSCSSSSSSSSISGNGIGIGIGKEPEVSSGQVETLVLEPEPEMEIPPVQESESVPNVEKGFSGFDLNQEFSSEEVGIGIGIDNPASASTPISIVSASRPEPATELPISPLQFEGALGWKGSAATSAFRKIPEVEKTFSSSSSHRSDGLNFDLNVTESGDDKTENLFSRDKMPVTSYQEPPRRLEKLELDLNSFGGGIGDSTTTTASASGITLDWNRDSRVASSFQTYPPTQSLPFKNIDLNLNDHSNVPNNPFLSKLFNKRDDSVISIFGTQVEVNPKDSNSSSISNSNSNSIPPPNGIDFTLGRPGSNSIPTPYPNLPNYTHNGFTMAPMYGPGGPSGGLGGLGGSGGYGSIPYMVDSRGAVVTPQIMQPVYSQPTHPFLYAPPGAPSGSNGAGPSRNNFDLNSGFMGDLGNRENNGGLGLRQFFNTNQNEQQQQLQQYLRMNNNNNNNNNNSLQASSSSVIGGKRMEPETGWDLFPVNYKHHQSQSQHHQNQNQQPPWQ